MRSSCAKKQHWHCLVDDSAKDPILMKRDLDLRRGDELDSCREEEAGPAAKRADDGGDDGDAHQFAQKSCVLNLSGSQSRMDGNRAGRACGSVDGESHPQHVEEVNELALCYYMQTLPLILKSGQGR